MSAVRRVRPFDALPEDLVEALAGMLRPASFRRGDVLAGQGREIYEAYIVLDGELEIAIDGQSVETVGPGFLVLTLALFVPELARIGTVIARTDGRCLALRREDVARLREVCPAFDQASRELAAERMQRLEQHLTAKLDAAVMWTRAAAGALRLGTDLPALALRGAPGEQHGSPLAVWLGILLDGIPESLVIGAGLFATLSAHPEPESLRFVHVIPFTLVAGLFLSNFPEALSSSANMQAQGWTRRRVFLMWLALMVTTAVGSGLGFVLASVISETWLVFAEGLAAGAMLTMIAAAMIPEAAAHGKPNTVGLSTLAGFLAAVMFKLLE
jgi:zinc transporter ZupT